MVPQTKTLYERIGGYDAVDEAVDTFYIKTLSDPRIKHFFTKIDMKSQHNHQKDFLTYAFGGTLMYKGKDMREAHQHLVKEQDLNESHFIAITENLKETLIGMGIEDDLIAEVMEVVWGTHDEVLDL